jgi:stage II sporulation protein D
LRYTAAMAWLVLLALALGPTPARAGRQEPPATLRVGTLALLVPQRVTVSALDAAVELPGGRRISPDESVVLERVGRRVVATGEGGWRWSGERLAVGGPDTRLSIDVCGRDRRTRTVVGLLTVECDGRALKLVVESDLERVVASAVASELEHVESPAALEAAAVAIRSFLVANRGRHAAEGFDVCDTTHCVFSRGEPSAGDAASRAAVAATAATRGLVLARDGRVVSGYVTACCGGRTTTPAELWGARDAGDYASVACDLCASSPYFRWRRSATVGAIAEAVSPMAKRRLGSDTAVETVAGPGGWVRWVALRSGGRATRVGGDAFRMAVERRLGWDSIPSPRFTVERDGGRLRFSGGGFGHGIGLCVAGAIERARRGASRDEILATYFPRARPELLEHVR